MQNILDFIIELNKNRRLFKSPSAMDLEIMFIGMNNFPNFFEKEVEPFIKISYQELLSQLKIVQKEQLSQNKIEQLVNIINYFDGINNEIITLIREVIITQIIANPKIEINLLTSSFLARHFLEYEKKNPIHDYQIIISEELEKKPKKGQKRTPGTYITDGEKLNPAIIIYIKEELELFKNKTKDELVYEILNTCYHELRHAIVDKLIQNPKIINLDLLQMAIDDSIFVIQKKDKTKDEPFFIENSYKMLEERVARIYGGKKALEIMKKYHPNLSEELLFKTTLIIKKEENSKIINRRYDYNDKDRFTLSNELLDKIITNHLPIIQQNKMISLIYHPNGQRKNIGTLHKEKKEVVNSIENEINYLQETDQLDLKGADRKINQLDKIDQLYDHLNCYNFKKMSFKEFQEFAYLSDNIYQSLKMSLLYIEKVLIKSKQSFNSVELTKKEWIENDKNLGKEYKEIYKQIETYHSYKSQLEEQALEKGGRNR